MAKFKEIVDQYVKKIRAQYGLAVREEQLPNGSEVILANDKVEVVFTLDVRIDSVECTLGLIKNRGRAGFQYSIEKILEFEGQDSSSFFNGSGSDPTISAQVAAYVNGLERFGHELLLANINKFDQLHQFSRGYNAAYTRYMSASERNLPSRSANRKIALGAAFRFFLLGALISAIVMLYIWKVY